MVVVSCASCIVMIRCMRHAIIATCSGCNQVEDSFTSLEGLSEEHKVSHLGKPKLSKCVTQLSLRTICFFLHSAVQCWWAAAAARYESFRLLRRRIQD